MRATNHKSRLSRGRSKIEMRTEPSLNQIPIILLACFAATAWAQDANRWRQLAPIEGGAVNALLSEGGRIYAGANGRGVFVSTDNGQTWNEADNGLGDLTVTGLGAAGGNVLAVTSGGIYLSG